MAHVAKTNELTDSLIRCISGLERNSEGYKAAKTATTKGLKDQSHARTNQFDVRSRLDGLVEKFAVLDRDDLSDALQERLDELPNEGKWLPEVLALLLELSHRPVLKTPPNVLQSLSSIGKPAEELTWDEFFGPSDADEAGLWQTIEHGYHSSGDDEVLLDNESEPTISTRATSVDDESEAAGARLHIIQPDTAVLDLVKPPTARAEQSQSQGRNVISEMSVVRESLSMLRGLTTDLYDVSPQTSKVTIKQRQTLATASEITLRAGLDHMAILGFDITALRRWTRATQSQPYLRTAQASCQMLLRHLDDQLSVVEKSYTRASADTVVSMIDLRTKVERVAGPVVELSRLVRATKRDSERSPFAILDALYDSVCAAQLLGDNELLAAMSTVLFNSVQTYLRPVTQWMTQGQIPPQDGHFLVVNSEPGCDLGDLWHRRTALRSMTTDKPSTPTFLHELAAEIFALGKAKMFLLHLSGHSSGQRDDAGVAGGHTGPDFSNLQQVMDESTLMPFSERFAEAFRGWIATTTNAAPTLQRLLLHDHGLLSACSALDHIYFSADGMNFQAFAESLFYRIESQDGRIPNAFLLTELARESLGSPSVVDAEALSITTSLPPKTGKNMDALQHIHLDYDFAWPVRNITRENSPITHSMAFAFLLQAFFAHSLLSSTVFDLRQMPSRPRSSTTNRLLTLRCRLMAFSNILLTHMTTVGRVLSAELRENMIAASDIDAMVTVFSAHKHRLETALLLGKSLKPVRDAAISLLGLCEDFRSLWSTAKTSIDGEAEGQSVKSIARLGKEFDESLAFMTAGVRGVSRSAGEVLLSALSERLEWMVS